MLVSQLDLLLLSVVIIKSDLVSCIPDCKCWRMYITLSAAISLISSILTSSTLRLWTFLRIVLGHSLVKPRSCISKDTKLIFLICHTFACNFFPREP